MGINLTNTNTVAAATAIIANKGKSTVSRKLTEEQEAGKATTIAGIRARAEEGGRVTYAYLGAQARKNGWIEPSKISDGQRGASLMKQIPEDLQAFVCQASGRYGEKAKTAFMPFLPTVEGQTPTQVLGIMRFLPALAPDKETGEVTERTFEPKVRAKKEVTEVASEDSAATL